MLGLYHRIKTRRIELGMSQEELAEKLGYKSRSSINKIEKGLNDISQTKIVEIAKALQTTPEWLMGWCSPDDFLNHTPPNDVLKAEKHTKTNTNNNQETEFDYSALKSAVQLISKVICSKSYQKLIHEQRSDCIVTQDKKERQLIEDYRALSESDQLVVLSMVHSLSNKEVTP